MDRKSITHISQLQPDPKNARKHTERNVGLIENALREVGAARSIVVDENGVILAGNATIEAAASAGIEEIITVPANGNQIVAVMRSGLTEDQKHRLALFDNRAAELAKWDVTVLNEFDTAGLLSKMWSPNEIEVLLADATFERNIAMGGDRNWDSQFDPEYLAEARQKRAEAEQAQSTAAAAPKVELKPGDVCPTCGKLMEVASESK